MTTQTAAVFAQVIPVLMIAIYLSDFRGLRHTKTWVRIVVFVAILFTAAIEAYLLLAIAVDLDTIGVDFTFAAVGVAILHLVALAVIASTNLFNNPNQAQHNSQHNGRTTEEHPS